MINTKGILARTYFDTFNVYRNGATIYSNQKCKLSKGGGNRNIVRTNIPEYLEYQSVIFCDPSLMIVPGDQIVVTLSDGIRSYSCEAGEPIVYHSHQEITVRRYVMQTNTGCTIYNKYINATTRMYDYKRTYLSNVYFDIVMGRKVTSSSTDILDKSTICIPENVTSTEQYKSPKEFNALVDKTGYFTLSMDDKICKGEIPDTVSVSDLESKYDYVFNIVSVSFKTLGDSNANYWEVGAN